MARNPNLNALSRQWELLKILPNKGPGLTSQQILDQLNDLGYQVTKRTVERDLRDLSEPFPIQCNDKGKPYGWFWTPGASAELPAITLAEALSIRLVEDLLKPLLPTAILSSLQNHFNQARNKLRHQQTDNPTAGWQDKARHVPPSLPMMPPSIDPAVLDTVQQALLHDKQIEVEYQTIHNDTVKKQTLHPLGLVQRGEVSYLVATAFDYQNIRLYAVHRIVSATCTEQEANRPADFDLDKYIASGALQFGANTQIQLKVKISKDLADYLSETLLSEDQSITEQEEDILLTATVTDSWQLRWWILSKGAAIEVLEPEPLRQEIRQTLSNALTQYE